MCNVHSREAYRPNDGLEFWKPIAKEGKQKVSDNIDSVQPFIPQIALKPGAGGAPPQEIVYLGLGDVGGWDVVCRVVTRPSLPLVNADIIYFHAIHIASSCQHTTQKAFFTNNHCRFAGYRNRANTGSCFLCSWDDRRSSRLLVSTQTLMLGLVSHGMSMVRS